MLRTALLLVLTVAAVGGGRGGIPGTPGLDYPLLPSVPRTSFSCHARPEGFYADPESRCQVFHICSSKTGAMSQQSFLCPNGTLFNSGVNICDWWNRVRCDELERPKDESTERLNRFFQRTEEPYLGTETTTELNLFRGFSEVPGNGQLEGMNSVENHQQNPLSEDAVFRDYVKKNNQDQQDEFGHGYLANALTTELSLNVGVSHDGFTNSVDSKKFTEKSRTSEISIRPRVHYTHSLKSASNTPLSSLNPIVQVARDSSLLSSFTNFPYSQDFKGTVGKSDRVAPDRKKKPVQRFVVDGVLPQYGNFDENNRSPSDDYEDKKGLGGDGMDSDFINPFILETGERGKSSSNEADITSTIQATFNDHIVTHNTNNNFGVSNSNVNNGLPSKELDQVDGGNNGVGHSATFTPKEIEYDNFSNSGISITPNVRNSSDNFFETIGASVGSSHKTKSTNPVKNTPSIIRVSTGYSFTPNNIKDKYFGYPKQLRVNNSFSVESQFTTASPVTKPGTTVSNSLFTPNLGLPRNPQTDSPDTPQNSDDEDFGAGIENQNNDFENEKISQLEGGITNSDEIKYIDRFVVNDSSSSSQNNNEDPVYNSRTAFNNFSDPEEIQFTPNIPPDYVSPTTEQSFSNGIKEENLPSLSIFTQPQTFFASFSDSEMNGFQSPQSKYLSLTTEANIFPNFPNFGDAKLQSSKTVTKPLTSAVNIVQESRNEDEPDYDINYKYGTLSGNTDISTPPSDEPSGSRLSGDRAAGLPTKSDAPNGIVSDYFSGSPYAQISGHYITQAPPLPRVRPFTSSQKDKQTLHLVENSSQAPAVEETVLASKDPYTPTVPPFTRPPTRFTDGPSPPTSPPPHTKYVSSMGPNIQLSNPPEHPTTVVYPSVTFRQPFPYNLLLGYHPALENSHLTLPAFPPHSAFYSFDPRLPFGLIQQPNLRAYASPLQPIDQVSNTRERVREKQDYDEILKESIGYVGYKSTTGQFSPSQAFDSTTSSTPTKQANELLPFTGSTVSVSPSVEAYSESTTLNPPSSFNDNPHSSSGRNSNVFSSSQENFATTTSPVSSKHSESPITTQAKALDNNKNTQSTLSFTGFSTPKPFLGGNQHQTYSAPQLQSTILPDYTQVGKQLFRPVDLLSINNLHKTVDLSTIRSINYAEIVKSLSFSFDSPEGRERFELARLKGLFER